MPRRHAARFAVMPRGTRTGEYVRRVDEATICFRACAVHLQVWMYVYVPQDRQSSALPSTKGQGARIGRLPRWPITFTLTTWRGQAVGSRIHDGDFARGGDLVPRRTIFDFHTFMLCAYSSHSSHSPHSVHSRHTRFVWAGPVGAAKRVGAVSAPRPRGVCGASVARGSVPGGWWAATGPAIRLRLAPVARGGAYVTGPCAIGPDWALPLRSGICRCRSLTRNQVPAMNYMLLTGTGVVKVAQ